MRNTAAAIADRIDRAIAAIGRAAAWCCLYVVVAEFAVVVLRYALGWGSIDVFYAAAGPRTKALIDLAGAIVFLLPFALALGTLSIPYAARSWAFLEGSREASGLPLVYLLKTLIPLFAVLIGLQGVAQAIHAAVALSGSGVPPPNPPPLAAERRQGP